MIQPKLMDTSGIQWGPYVDGLGPKPLLDISDRNLELQQLRAFRTAVFSGMQISSGAVFQPVLDAGVTPVSPFLNTEAKTSTPLPQRTKKEPPKSGETPADTEATEGDSGETERTIDVLSSLEETIFAK